MIAEPAQRLGSPIDTHIGDPGDHSRSRGPAESPAGWRFRSSAAAHQEPDNPGGLAHRVKINTGHRGRTDQQRLGRVDQRTVPGAANGDRQVRPSGSQYGGSNVGNRTSFDSGDRGRVGALIVRSFGGMIMFHQRWSESSALKRDLG